MKTKHTILTAMAVAAAMVGHASADISHGETSRLAAAAQVAEGIHNIIPQDYWDKARCVAVIPDLKKLAFILGGEYGKGVMSCRTGDGWSAPMFVQLAKGSWGFQAGAEQIDVVMLVMNEGGVQKLLDRKVTLGVGASVAAGPVGRQGQLGTDVALTAEIVSYSRAQGLFAGIDLSGGVIQPDEDANRAVYGRTATTRSMLASREIAAPPEAAPFLRALNASSASASPATAPSSAAAAPVRPVGAGVPTVDSDLRTRLVDVQQTLERLMTDGNRRAVGTSGTSPIGGSNGTIVVDRAQLEQLQRQLDAAIAALNTR